MIIYLLASMTSTLHWTYRPAPDRRRPPGPGAQRSSLLPGGVAVRLRPGEELRQYPAECGLVGRRQAIAEQRRYKLQVRFNGSQQGGPPIVDTAFAEQHAIPQLFLTRPHARQVGEVHQDVEPLQRQLVLAQHLIGKLLDDLPVRSEKGLPKGGLVIQLR